SGLLLRTVRRRKCHRASQNIAGSPCRSSRHRGATDEPYIQCRGKLFAETSRRSKSCPAWVAPVLLTHAARSSSLLRYLPESRGSVQRRIRPKPRVEQQNGQIAL